mmetsp:Transcript_31099/g.99259  ORF Transcript_31099/g.99259 Transcript_31099/m.99259 type:complete len:206 (+) Transcript_31099:203-820(+)
MVATRSSISCSLRYPMDCIILFSCWRISPASARLSQAALLIESFCSWSSFILTLSSSSWARSSAPPALVLAAPGDTGLVALAMSAAPAARGARPGASSSATASQPRWPLARPGPAGPLGARSSPSASQPRWPLARPGPAGPLGARSPSTASQPRWPLARPGPTGPLGARSASAVSGSLGCPSAFGCSTGCSSASKTASPTTSSPK